MRSIVSVIIIAVLILLVLVFVTNPELLDGVWLWLIGLAGGVIGFFRNIVDQIRGVFKNQGESELATAGATAGAQGQPQVAAPQQPDAFTQTVKKVDTLIEKIEGGNTVFPANPTFDGTTLTVLRYSDDGETTLGLLFLRNQFIAYCLEDTFREEKVQGETRIPSGIYDVDFLKQDTNLTKKYREKYPWFTYHLEIKNVPNYTGVFIHIGNTHKDTAGCLLIADGINASSVNRMIVESANAYKRFYLRMKDLIESGEKLRIVIHDENWFKKVNLHTI
ncbi:MAG: DUF5675 family protein [Bacteroidales bacterium]|nr:DUF5675 family protein [Bacteroidales bacterium]MCF8458433.1 DUF5675 family protein [Bacteroidales bacterium]